MAFRIAPYDDRHREQVLSLSLRAWGPVFEKFEPAVPSYVYRAFYPQGWEDRQEGDISRYLDAEAQNVWVALKRDTVIGWVGIRLHPQDLMGEVHIIAVDPNHQRQGVASGLLAAAAEHMRSAGMRIAMVETGDDPGHAASRLTYERNGFERWPVARYFRKL